MVGDDRIVESIFELGMLIAYFRNDFYGNNNFKVNAKGKADLSERQYVILMILKYTDINSLTKMAEQLQSSHSNLSILISKLADNGYIRKEHPCHKDDKRKIYFYITPSGEDKLREMTENIEACIFCFYKSLDEEQQQLLKEGINCFIRMDPELEKSLPMPPDSAGEQALTNWLFKASIKFFTWKTQKFMKEFKVNGNDGRLLTDRQFGLLFAIRRLRRNTISKLEELVNVENSTISNAVSKLVRDGFLVRRHPDCGDGRIVYFAITEKGETAMQQVTDNLRLCISNYVKPLSEEQRRGLIEGVSALSKLFTSLPKKIIH